MSSDDWQDDRDPWQDTAPDPWDAYEQSQSELPGSSISEESAKGRWSEWQARGYETPAGPGQHGRVPHSGVGIASVALTMFAGLAMLVAMIGLMFITVQNPNIAEDNPQVLGLVCGMLISLLVAAIGGVLGLIGLFQSDRNKLFPIVGCLLAGLEIGAFSGLMLIGLVFG